MHPYWEDPAPGAGRREPRADAVTSARTMSLNGVWRFRLSRTSEGTGPEFAEEDFDDLSWDTIVVPSHWVLEDVTPPEESAPRSLRGTSQGPLYTNTALPVPLDPPTVPHENPTGDYRREVVTPADWGRSVLRFQGVDSCAQVWVNGQVLGWSTGSRLPFEFDVPLRPGRNVIAVRVHRWSAGTYLEDQDMWWLPGIFRDVELIERPYASIEDHFVHADYDHVSGLGTLRVEASAPGTVRIPELGVEMSAGESATVPVQPWSAESPRLYRGTLTALTPSEGVSHDREVETIDLAVGFRTIDIADGVVRVNGARVFFRGVNRHEHHPDTGRTLDRATMVADITSMKRHNINAVRTSHYPPHPDFLRLCDEYGLWVVEEGDLETHGFIYAAWHGNPLDEPMWRAAVLDRTRRMVERDKNRPSVVMWSLANESGRGANLADMESWIRRRDPSRPLHYERDPSYRHSDVASLMYPSLELLEQIGRREDPRPDGVTDAQDRRRRSLPFLLCEYAHAMGNGPGSLADYHRVLRSHDRFCGAFVWEWIDHGLHHTDAQGRQFVMHGGDVAARPSGGRYCLDGLVFSDRIPGPGAAELAAVLQPVQISVTEVISVRNDHDHIGLEHISFGWALERDGVAVADGVLQVPPLAPGERAILDLPVRPGPEPGEWWLTVSARLSESLDWGPAGHVIARQQGRLEEHEDATGPRPPASRTRPAATSPHWEDDTVRLGAGTFDADSGRLIAVDGLELLGPVLDLYRAPIENDRGQGGANDLAGVWSAVGLDRLVHRTHAVERDGDDLVVLTRVASASHPHAVLTRSVWRAEAEGLLLDVSVSFVGPWSDTPHRNRDIVVPRLGLRLGLPGGYRSVSWFGRGPGQSYRDSHCATTVGRYTSSVDDLQVDFPVPQENGNHIDTRRLQLTGPGLPTLVVQGEPLFDFTCRRWTSEHLEQARHPRDLVDSGRVWLNVDHAQLGLGSASVGPAIPDAYRIQRSQTRWQLRLSTSEPRGGSARRS